MTTAAKGVLLCVDDDPDILDWMKLILGTAGYAVHTADGGHAALAAVDLGPFEDRYPFELSGGMQQRAGLARVLVNDPRLILCDEPFGSLDWITREGLQDLLLALWAKTRKTVVLATHSIEEAVYLAQRVVVLTLPPAAVQEIVTVDLPAGRGGAVRFHPRYAEYVEYLGGAVAGERPADAAASRG
jgi:ABC-type nitrate/sulfonate/bicarbonate transport system ATPase subunit